MTKEEKLFNEFLEKEPSMTDSEFDEAIDWLADQLNIKKSDVESLINLSDTSSYNSKEFEKTLKRMQAYRQEAKDFKAQWQG